MHKFQAHLPPSSQDPSSHLKDFHLQISRSFPISTVHISSSSSELLLKFQKKGKKVKKRAILFHLKFFITVHFWEGEKRKPKPQLILHVCVC